MAYNETPFYKAKGLVAYFNGQRMVGLRNLQGLTTSGSVSEINITTIEATTVATTGGLGDVQGMAADFVGALHSPLGEEFLKSNKNRRTQLLTLFVGGKEDGRRITDGREELVNDELSTSRTDGHNSGFTFTAGSATTDAIITYSLAYADRMPNGVAVNDFFRIGGYGASARYYRIKRIERTNSDTVKFYIAQGGKNTVADGLLTNPDAGNDVWTGDDKTIDIVRPAFKWEFPCYVSNNESMAGAGSIFNQQIRFRFTDECHIFFGGKVVSSNLVTSTIAQGYTGWTPTRPGLVMPTPAANGKWDRN